MFETFITNVLIFLNYYAEIGVLDEMIMFVTGMTILTVLAVWVYGIVAKQDAISNNKELKN